MTYDQGRDLTPEQREELQGQVEALVTAYGREHGVEGLWYTVHDDRSRRIAEGERDIGAGAAALAQQLLKIADELMRMAGNARHNSPNGFDRVAEDILGETAEKLVRALSDTTRLQRELREWYKRGGWRELRR